MLFMVLVSARDQNVFIETDDVGLVLQNGLHRALKYYRR